MELIKTDNRSAFAEAIQPRDGALRQMLGMGSDPVGHGEDEQPHQPQVGLWRIASNRDRSRADWTDTAVTGVKRRQDRPPIRTPTAVSGVWLFLLSSRARRNGLLSFRLGARRR